ncbi:hypothetical protein [Pinisolibacter sp.]|uniref:hypothetical protein n=1 Tax=Pinisolibacter sp. TaxID=2172024 RepID=UPI002FDCFAE5
MDTGAIRPYATIVHDPPNRRDDVAGGATATDLPTEKTVRAAQPSQNASSTDDRRRDQERAGRLAIRAGFERDLPSGSVVYRWTDETTERVILEIPRSDKIRSRAAYEQHDRTSHETPAVDRSV